MNGYKYVQVFISIDEVFKMIDNKQSIKIIIYSNGSYCIKLLANKYNINIDNIIDVIIINYNDLLELNNDLRYMFINDILNGKSLVTVKGNQYLIEKSTV